MGPFALTHLVLLVVAGLATFASASEAIHHTVISVSNMHKSVCFYRDGIGLDVLIDTEVEGDWKTLFGAKTNKFHRVLLGDSRTVNNGTNGVLQLAQFPAVTKGPKVSYPSPQTGFNLVSFWIGDEVNSTLARLHSLGFGGKPRIATFGDKTLTTYATVRDPDGAQVLLVGNPYVNSLGQGNGTSGEGGE